MMVGYIGSPFPTPFMLETIPDHEVVFTPKSPKPNIAELILMSSMMQPYGSTNPLPIPTGTKPNGLRGKDWSNHKARSKMARKSKKRNKK